MATSLASNFKVVSVSPISEQIRRLQIISCDFCGTNRASCDVFVDGVISGITVLKRCCDTCVGSFSQ